MQQQGHTDGQRRVDKKVVEHAEAREPRPRERDKDEAPEDGGEGEVNENLLARHNELDRHHEDVGIVRNESRRHREGQGRPRLERCTRGAAAHGR
eukprot:4967045-Prymnesium_polylepis.1